MDSERDTAADSADNKWTIRGIGRGDRETIKAAADRRDRSVAQYLIDLVAADVRAERAERDPAAESGEIMPPPGRALEPWAPVGRSDRGAVLAALLAAAASAGRTPADSNLPRGVRAALIRRIRAELA